MFKIRKSQKIVRKRLAVVLTCILGILGVSLTVVFPVENLFIDFESPESVFHYTEIGTIDKIIDGQDSCMIIYSKGKNVTSYCFIPKTNDGYKIPGYLIAKKVSHKFDKDRLFDVYNVKGTLDYYVSGSSPHISQGDVVELFNGKDEKVDSDIVIIGMSDFIYFYVYDFTDKYYLLVNGDKISIST